MRSSSHKVAVVIPNWNGEKWLPGCLSALAAQGFEDFETVLVDNGSTDGSVLYVKQHDPRVRIIELGSNRGFAAAVNAGIGATQSDYVALLNTDTQPRPGWLAALVAAMDRSDSRVGALASRMLSLDAPGIIDDAGDVLSWHGAAAKRGHGRPAAEYEAETEVFSPCAGAALYRRSLLEELGGFDEAFFAYLEDLDLGLRGRLLGYRYLYVPGAEVLHKGHGAGLARGAYVRLMTCNRLLLLAKNIPLALWLRHIGQIAYGQLYFLAAYRRPLHSLAGYVSFLRLLPHVARQRRGMGQRRRALNQEIEELLEKEMPELSLRVLIRKACQAGGRVS